eukprot:gene2217-12597_t
MSVPQAHAGWTVTHETGKGFFRMTKSEGGADVMIDC